MALVQQRGDPVCFRDMIVAVEEDIVVAVGIVEVMESESGESMNPFVPELVLAMDIFLLLYIQMVENC